MSFYRTHLCSELTIKNLNQEVILSGWIDTIRDHGNLIFIDLRDNYGITQCVVDAKKEIFENVSKLSNESVVKIKGIVVKRSEETINKNLKTGYIEVDIFTYELSNIFYITHRFQIGNFFIIDFSKPINISFQLN